MLLPMYSFEGLSLNEVVYKIGKNIKESEYEFLADNKMKVKYTYILNEKENILFVHSNTKTYTVSRAFVKMQ